MSYKKKAGQALSPSNPNPRIQSKPTHPTASKSDSPAPESCCQEDEPVSNADILRAVNALAVRFSNIELLVNKNTAEIAEINDKVTGLEMKCKGTDEQVIKQGVTLSDQEQRQEEAERYSRRWNLRLHNLVETVHEDTRLKVLELFAQICPEETPKLGFMVDSVHRVGSQREDGSPRPIIIQFTMRTFRQSVWRASATSAVMKEKNLRLAEDLTYLERQNRNTLWPLVEKARLAGKKTKWQGAVAIIDGVRFTADQVPASDSPSPAAAAAASP